MLGQFEDILGRSAVFDRRRFFPVLTREGELLYRRRFTMGFPQPIESGV